MPAPKRVSWRAERRDLGALGFTNATTPRPSDAAAEQSSSTQQLMFQSFSPRVPSPPATPCQMIIRSVSSELVRLLTKLTAFSGQVYHRPHQENASKHKITISVLIQSKPNRLWSKTERPRCSITSSAQRRIEKRNVEAERASRCRRVRSLTEVVARPANGAAACLRQM
jgi:hypothetical protein